MPLFAQNAKNSLLGEPKNRMHKISAIENRNNCKQDTENRTLSLLIIFSLRDQISNKE